jgi:transposase
MLLSDAGWSYRRIAEALLWDEETISKHVDEYRTQQKLSIQTGGSKSKLSDEQELDLVKHLESKTYLKVAEICDYVIRTYGVHYAVSGMTNWLKRKNFAFIKLHPVPAKADPEKQALFAEEYEKLKKETPKDESILFFDAVHPTMATKVAYGWIKKRLPQDH